MKYGVSYHCRTSGHLLVTTREQHRQNQEVLNRAEGPRETRVSPTMARHSANRLQPYKCPRDRLAQVTLFRATTPSHPTPETVRTLALKTPLSS